MMDKLATTLASTIILGPSTMQWYVVVLLMNTCLAIDSQLCPFHSQNVKSDATRQLIINPSGNNVTYPKNYRSSAIPISFYISKYQKEFGPVNEVPSTAGFQKTKMYGSSQFRPSQLQSMAQVWEGKSVIIIDLRMESHGFLNDAAVSFFCPRNWDLLMTTDVTKLMEVERADFRRLGGETNTRVYDKIMDNVTNSTIIEYDSSITEGEFVNSLGLKYVRIHVPDHRRPRDIEVEKILLLFDEYQDDEMYFHCQAGRGRTTTAMIMRDIYINAHNVPYHTILMRNFIYSRYNTFASIKKNQGNYRESNGTKRLEFLEVFYSFMKQRHGRTWLEFLADEKGKISNKIIRQLTTIIYGFIIPLVEIAQLEDKSHRLP